MILEGQTALVTGGGLGIGREVARLFSSEGASVAVLDIEPSRAEEVTSELSGGGGAALAISADVADQEAVHRAVEAAMERFGRLDIAVNNAGIEHMAPFLEIDRRTWDRHLAVHLSGSFFVSQAAARRMARAGYGRIVNVSSVAGLMGPIDSAAYGAAKAGVLGLTRAAALDLADHGITVNAVVPGPIETAMSSVWTPEALAERAQHLPIARFGTTSEVARAVLFLSSPDSSFITGTTIVIDGGSVAAGSYMVEKRRRRGSDPS